MNSRIAITHIGLCTPLGNSPEEVLPRLINGDVSAMQWRDNLLFNAPTLVGCVDDKRLIAIADHLSLFACRNNRLLNTAAQQLIPAVEQAKQRFGADRIGVVLGTSTSGISKGEAALKYKLEHGNFPPSYHYSQQELGSTSEYLKQLFSLSGPCYTVSTACSSSAKVFASAQRLLNANLCDMVIVGGVDSLCQLTVNGFAALESVSKGHCNPFSHHRDGINIGEGAALFTLERGQSDVMLAGIGESADAHHISAPHPQGHGAIAAMQLALSAANISPQQINYVNLHGTATPKNDAMESRAINALFNYLSPLCSSTKPLTGHTLGAAGAIEAAFCYLLLSPLNHSKRLPPHVWDGQFDDNDPQISLINAHSNTGLSELNFIMSNSFAFGGSNASLIFCRKDA
ncbi:beta-ketoacyl-[acyl-carrier-protein] synthase family protein [Shewanella sp. SG44-6]|uniref:beta-ketoacyl-[acyl-carrier-protein] synthase family protein n=1 Tax=Shewanella sp. SG44-6 TaxID=2760959 RepID=UPI0016008D16|nr:beta-ketoacyl-[acyl-carrier-protein] synthase family protein [Shewanella sp. SG44-6]MBB1390124.1 beta-ketoacyl-[acyl-carrier-protein] synthase family protein [Shewanella sp. SG44-6]